MARLYEGRQAKSIQRRMIVDACRRLANVAELSEYQYVGFGGLEFHDFIEMHNALGVRTMTSIEHDSMIYDRVEFNKPYEGVTVLVGEARDMLPKVDWSRLAITWLDYTCPLNLDVLRDVDYVVRASTPGSLVLATVRADVGQKLDARLEQMQGLLGDSLPSGLTSDGMNGWGVSGVQRTVLQNRAHSVAREHGGSFEQLFNFRYQDGVKMLTWGGIVSATNVKRSIDQCRFEELSYVRQSEVALEVRVPSFTEKERRFFEHGLAKASGARPALKGIAPDDVKAFAEIYRWRAS